MPVVCVLELQLLIEVVNKSTGLPVCLTVKVNRLPKLHQVISIYIIQKIYNIKHKEHNESLLV